MTKHASNEIFFTIKDFKVLYKKNKVTYFKIGTLCFSAVFVFFLIKNPVFKVEAKLKNAEKAQVLPPQLKSFLSFLPPSDNVANVASIMKSREFLKSLVSEMGMQASVEQKGFLSKKLGYIKCNILGTFDKKIISSPSFSFSHVTYEGGDDLHFKMRVSEDKSFEILDHNNGVLAVSKIGSLIELPEVSFVLESLPKNVSFQKLYKITIAPWEGIVKTIQQNFVINEDKHDSELLNLSFCSSSQDQSAAFLNYIMHRYIEYAKNEKEEISQKHLTFLEGRKTELENTYSQFLEDHTAYLVTSLEKEGFLGLRQEMEVLEKPNEDYNTKLYEVELELNRLAPISSFVKNNDKQLEKEGNVIPESSLAANIFSKRNKRKEFSGLQLQEKLGALLKNKFEDKDYSKTLIMGFANSLLQEDMELLDQYKEEAFNILQTLEKRNSFVEASQLQFAPNSLLANWISQLKSEETKLSSADLQGNEVALKKLEDKKGKLKIFLNTFLLALEKKQNSLLDKEIEDGFTSVELQGLNPETAQQLYLGYNHELDAVKLNIKQLIYLKEQIYDPNVELSSLCNLLTDPISQQMIQKAGQMSLELRDDFNRSSREHERLKDSLTTQKIFLKNHITQMIDIQRMRAKLIEDKILSLQQSSVNLLCTEKQLIQDRLADLRKTMSSSLPKKWKMESELQLKKELHMRMIEGIAQLEESKRVEQNMLPSGCKILESAMMPKTIQPPGLFLYPILLSFLLMIAKYGYDFFRRVSRGSPISFELLKHYDFHTCGSISSYSDAPIGEINASDLETLRRLAHFASLQKKASEGLSLALLGDSQSNFSHNLSKILSQRGYKVLLIDSTFHGLSSGQSSSGLLAYLRGEVESPAIHAGNGYNFIYSGGYSRNFVGLLSHKKFADFILASKKDYDFVVIHSSASSSSLEATIYQSISDVCVVSAGFEDSLEDLESFIEWKEKKNRDCLTFVLRES